jgi:hypothetical protein
MTLMPRRQRGPAYHLYPIRLESFTIDGFLRTLFPEARRCPHV